MVVHLAHLDEKQSSYGIVATAVRVLQVHEVPIVWILFSVIRIQKIATVNTVPQKRRMEINQMNVGVAVACFRNDAIENRQHFQSLRPRRQKQIGMLNISNAIRWIVEISQEYVAPSGEVRGNTVNQSFQFPGKTRFPLKRLRVRATIHRAVTRG